MSRKIKIINIVGTRPNFIKIAPLLAEQKKYSEVILPVLVHTGQHYDFELSEVFFKDLNIPKPDYHLGVGSGSHARQTAEMMRRFDRIILKEKPDLVLVVGDCNSTLAGALVAAKLHIPVVHIEAGLRSFDMSMPEEINRRLTDHISDYLFVTELSGVKNLLNEGIKRKKIFFVGNVMIDTLLNSRFKIQNSKILEKLGLDKKKYAVLTLHRPENVDDKKIFKEILETISAIQKKIKIIWPIHPHTKKQLVQLSQFERLKIKKSEGLRIVKPLSYLEMLNLMKNAKLVLTDSGGIQEETTVLGIPCLTLRENTERPVTCEIGTNMVCGTTREKILQGVNKVLWRGLRCSYTKQGRIPKYWDGRSAERIMKIIKKIYQP